MIRFSAIVLVGLFAVIGYWFTDTVRARTVSEIFDTLINGDPVLDQTVFENRALNRANQRRAAVGLAPLEKDPEIQQALDRFAAGHERLAELDLQRLFPFLQREFPSAQFLSATVLLNPLEEALVEGVSDWSDVIDPDHVSLSTLVFRDGWRKGCLAVLSRRLPAFDLEKANREGGRFIQRCPHSDGFHSIVLNRQSETVILACPDCQRPYDVLAADATGAFHRACDFLEGFSIPGASRPAATDDDRFQLMTHLWSQVLRHCRYEHDRTGLDVDEAWKRPSQTWRDASGDCEDTSLLLADALNAVGIEARVAIGWNRHIGQHAWCVARIGSRQWVLESTLSPEEGETPVPRPVAEVGDEYQPEQLFDRRFLYFRVAGEERSGCDDYWSDSHWDRLPGDRQVRENGS